MGKPRPRVDKYILANAAAVGDAALLARYSLQQASGLGAPSYSHCASPTGYWSSPCLARWSMRATSKAAPLWYVKQLSRGLDMVCKAHT